MMILIIPDRYSRIAADNEYSVQCRGCSDRFGYIRRCRQVICLSGTRRVQDMGRYRYVMGGPNGFPKS